MKNQMGYLDLHLESVMYTESSYLTMNKINIIDPIISNAISIHQHARTIGSESRRGCLR